MEAAHLSSQQRTLLLLVITARNESANVAAALHAVMRRPPSRATVDALMQLLDSDAIAYQPGESAAAVIARIEAQLATAAND